MKKLLKKEVCESHEHCPGSTEQPTTTENHGSKKKRKEREMHTQNALHFIGTQTVP